MRRELFQWIFALRISLGGGSHYAATPFIVALSPGNSDTTRFHPWSPTMIENHLDRAEKIPKVPKVAHMTGTIDIFDPCSGISGPTSQRASTCPNLRE